jgi:hypothetical protein
MPRRIDPRQPYYWRVDFIQPALPGDDRCVMLYGQDGEIVGPMTMALAEAWMDRFDNRERPADYAKSRTKSE